LLAKEVKARVLNVPENQAKLGAGEGVFKGFDPTTDPAYLTSFKDNIYDLGQRYRLGYEEPHYYGGYTVAQVAHPQQLVGPTSSADQEDYAAEQASTGFDNELIIDNDISIGEKDGSGTDRVTRREDKLLAARPMRSSSISTSRPESGNFDTPNKPMNASSLQATLHSGASSTLSLLPTSNTENEDNSSSSVSSKRTPYIPSYSSMNNAKKKKDNGNEFMRTKVKYFDDWLRRMKRAPLPQRPRGRDGKYTISRFKQKSEAIKALTSADDKSLLAFINTKQKALGVVEQTGTADPSLYDDDGMLVVQHGASSSKLSNQPLNPKKRGREELGEEDEVTSSEKEDSDATSAPKKHCTSKYV
jgi:hypothetical protein